MPSPRVIDWAAVAKKAHTFSGDQLMQYMAAGVDPYTVQIAQVLGQQFKLAPHGQRNLANAFASLPQAEFYRQRLGLGFSDRHIARLLANSDDGFVFLGICACLGEYYTEDVVVGVLMQMLRSFDIPVHMAPGGMQWKTLVHLCKGVLATSPFGILITRAGTAPQLSGDHVNLRTIVTGLLGMSDVVNGVEKHLSLTGGADVYWFAAVAEYLFDLTMVIRDRSGEVLFTLDSGAAEPQVTLQAAEPHLSGHSFDLSPLSELYGDIIPASGGRVGWEKLFRSCFGRAFTNIEPRLIAEFIGGAACLTSESLKHDHTNTQVYFLPQASSIPGLSGVGLVATLTSWFPELRGLAPRMEKISRWSFQEARDKMDEVSEILDSSCMCDSCGNASSTSTEICKHSLVEVMMGLGLLIARTVVVPNLFPKRSGILAFYKRYHAGRVSAKGQRKNEPEDFMELFSACLPTPREMIENMCLLFTGTIPQQNMDETVSISHEGIFVSLTSWRPDSAATDATNEHARVRQRAGVSVFTGSSSFHGRIFDRGYWARSFGEASMSFSESFELMRTRPKDLTQISRPNKGNMEISFIFSGKGEEEKARELGWEVW